MATVLSADSLKLLSCVRPGQKEKKQDLQLYSYYAQFLFAMPYFFLYQECPDPWKDIFWFGV